MNPLVVVRYVSRRRGETNVGGVWERRVEFKAGRPFVDFLVLQLQLLLATTISGQQSSQEGFDL